MKPCSKLSKDSSSSSNPIVYVGIDPGKTGWVCSLISNGRSKPAFLKAFKLVNEKDWLFHLESIKKYPLRIYVEKAQSMPGQGVKSMFNYGMGFGKILGLIEAHDMEYSLVPPIVWHKKLFEKTRAKGKEAAEEFVEEIYSLDVELAEYRSKRKGSRYRRLPDGLVDALCIAHYGWKSDKEENN